MLSVARLRKTPRHFKSFAGLTPEQFDQLLAALTPVYLEQERARSGDETRAQCRRGSTPPGGRKQVYENCNRSVVGHLRSNSG
jgi:hypothetical protein